MVKITTPLSSLEATMVSDMKNVQTNDVSFGNFTFDCNTITDASGNVFVRRKKGKWERVSMDKYIRHAEAWYRCDQCGAEYIGMFNFCGNCGADMRGEK